MGSHSQPQPQPQPQVPSTCRLNKKKIINKSEREKLKRDQLNELFIILADALELTQQNNGKASIVTEATRLLKGLFGEMESLRKENASLLTESNYVTLENIELKEDKYALQSQIEKLHYEIEERVAQPNPDSNVSPPKLHQQETMSRHPGHALGQQVPPTVLLVPLHTAPSPYPTPPDTAQLNANTSSVLSKPQARYLSPTDSWQSLLLKEQLTGSK